MKSTTCCSSSTLTGLIKNLCRIVFSLSFPGPPESLHRLRVSHQLERFGDCFHPLSRNKIRNGLVAPGDDNQAIIDLPEERRQLGLSLGDGIRR